MRGSPARAYCSRACLEAEVDDLKSKYEKQVRRTEDILEDANKRLVEMVELPGHPYFVGCQFHPEFKSRPASPHPLFARFVRAALERQAARVRSEGRKLPETQTVIN